MKQSVAYSLLLASVATARTLAIRDDADCRDVHIFLARGNNEPYPGRQGKLVNAICEGLSSCDYEDIQFYNPLESNYCDAVHEGIVNGKAQITAYSQKCPSSKLVLSGFSQGGDVASSILAGGGGSIFECTGPEVSGLSANSQPGKQIVAALFFGDVRHTANQPWNILGGAPYNGVQPRSAYQLSNLAAYGGALRDWCNVGDGVCADGNTVAEHLNYFDVYTDDAAAFVHERLAAVDVHTTVPSPPAASSTVPWALNSTATTGPSVICTVPAYGDDSHTTYQPAPVTTVVPEVLTVTEECESQGSVYTEYHTTTVDCAICSSVSEYTQTATVAVPTGVLPSANSTMTYPSPTAPVTAGASSHLPKLGGVAVAIAALMAL